MAVKRTGSLKRSRRMRRGAPIKAMSTKRQGERAAYDAALEVVDRRDRGVCLAAVIASQMAVPYTTLCKGRRDAHHLLPVGQGGRRADPLNIATLCRWHHDWVHQHAAEAVALGLLRRNRPAQRDGTT